MRQRLIPDLEAGLARGSTNRPLSCRRSNSSSSSRRAGWPAAQEREPTQSICRSTSKPCPGSAFTPRRWTSPWPKKISRYATSKTSGLSNRRTAPETAAARGCSFIDCTSQPRKSGATLVSLLRSSTAPAPRWSAALIPTLQPPAKTAILGQRHHVELGEPIADRLHGPVTGSVVDDDRLGAPEPCVLQALQALEGLVAPIPAEHDDHHVGGRQGIHGRRFDPNRIGGGRRSDRRHGGHRS